MRHLRALIVALMLAFALASAGTAQAEEWVIAGQPLPVLGVSGETTTISGGTSELTVPALSLTAVCTSTSGSGEIEGSVTGSASVTFKGCTVKGAEKTCTISSPGQSAGTLSATVARKFFILEVENVEQAYEEFVPTMTVEFTGVFCPLPEELKMGGTTAAEAPKVEEELVERTLKFSQAIEEASGVEGLTLGANPAYITGEGSEVLNGAFSEEAFGTTEISVSPSPVKFGGLESRFVVITNTGPMKVKYTKIEIVEGAGPFTLTDFTPCKGKEFPATKTCTIGVTCNTTSNVGKLEIRWDILAANGDLMGFNRRFVNLTC